MNAGNRCNSKHCCHCRWLQGAPLAPGQIASSNAYMLLYRQRGFQEPPAPVGPDQLPEPSRQEVAALHSRVAEACTHYEQHSQQVLAALQQRRQVGLLGQGWGVFGCLAEQSNLRGWDKLLHHRVTKFFSKFFSTTG